jgi:5-methylcytosine-specific restriction endonuclease McrA
MRQSKEARVRRRKRLLDFCEQVKVERGCFLCGSKTDLTFHHIDPATKSAEVKKMVRNGRTFAKTIEEINKCVVLCNDCHVELHKQGIDGELSKIVKGVYHE